LGGSWTPGWKFAEDAVQSFMLALKAINLFFSFLWLICIMRERNSSTIEPTGVSLNCQRQCRQSAANLPPTSNSAIAKRLVFNHH